jgi:F-type H+-transporting ATPase subunit b
MAETAHTEAPAGGKEVFPPFQRDTFASQLFWLALAFIALYVIMARLALPRIEGIFEARRARIGGDLADAQRLKGESEQTMASYEKELADARAEAQSIANDTREKLNAESEERRKKLEAKLHEEIANAEQAIAATKSAAMANVEAIAAEATTAIVERLVGLRPDPASVKAAVGAALKS